ncbi:MAG TPA: 30S ribosomal protein S6 [bacterium]|nr:30S ribosomal protein S6 [bacterium]
MRKYELLYILKHDSAPEKTAAAREKINSVIESEGGMLVNEDVWGKKKLAFEVRKYQKGIFILTHFLGEPSHIREIERNLKLNQEVLRYLTVKLTDKIDLEEEKATREKWQADKARADQEAAEAGAPAESDDEEEEEEDDRGKDRDDDDFDGDDEAGGDEGDDD